VADLLFTRKESLPLLVMGDRQLNNVAAMTWNATTCDKIFAIIEKALTPEDYPYRTLHTAVLLTHTILLYGSEVAVDRVIRISRFIFALQTYNSALVKKNSAFGLSLTGGSSGGIDKGEPVRLAAKVLFEVLNSDDNIRSARSEAKAQNPGALVPMGDDILGSMVAPAAPSSSNPGLNAGLQFGMATEKALGAGFSLDQVPGMYEGRPERYFDNQNDERARRNETGDHQFTREGVMQATGASLLDLAFDSPNGEEAAPAADAGIFLQTQQQQQVDLQNQLSAAQEQIRLMQQQTMQMSTGGTLLDLVSGPSSMHTAPSSSAGPMSGMMPMPGMVQGMANPNGNMVTGVGAPQTSMMGVNLSSSGWTGAGVGGGMGMGMMSGQMPQMVPGQMPVPMGAPMGGQMMMGQMQGQMGMMQPDMKAMHNAGGSGAPMGAGMSMPMAGGLGMTMTAAPPSVPQPNTISDHDGVPNYAPPPPPAL